MKVIKIILPSASHAKWIEWTADVRGNRIFEHVGAGAGSPHWTMIVKWNVDITCWV
jgi:hypothetical protein